jgi:hypothetical protein
VGSRTLKQGRAAQQNGEDVMTISRSAVLVATVGVVAAGLGGGAALAGPLPETNRTTMNPYDISFEDGRTSSKIGRGLLNIRGFADTGDPDDIGPVAACYAEGTSLEVIAAVEAALRGGYQSRYQIGARWTGITGDPHGLTWSFVPDGLSIPSGIGEPTANSILFSRMDSLFASQGGRAAWVAQFEASFNRWSELTGLTYTRVRNVANSDWDDGAAWGTAGGTNRGDVRISMKNIDNASNILAYNAFPQNGDMVLDSSESWASGGNNFRFLRNVIMHEHGHGLGFNHVCPGNGTKLMEPLLATGFDGPQHDDMRAGQRNYGDKFEPDNSPGAATQLGVLAPGSSLTLGNMNFPTIANAALLSIDATSEVDWFAVQLDDPRLLDITLTPFGQTYRNGPQNANGSCSTGVDEFSLSAADLVVQVYKSNGNSLLRTQDATGAGSAEAISGVMCANGISYIKVSAAGTVSGTQFYKLQVNVRSTSLAPSASDGTFGDRVRVTWATIPDATSYQVYRNLNDAQFGGTTLATINAPTTTFDDMTAVPGQEYYYFVRVLQPDDTGYRFTSNSGNPGRANAAPVADAGPDQVVVDSDSSGAENVLLDASGSNDSDGSIIVYRWMEGATLLSQSGSPTATVSLPVGIHTITLTVVDNGSLDDTDEVVVTVVPPTGGCGTADFDGDGDTGTDADIEAFFACLAGSCCPTCFTGGADFNGDGDTGTDADIEAFFRVLAGGPC